MRPSTVLVSAALGLLLLAAPRTVSAQTVLVTSRAALGAGDHIDWGVLGGPVSNFPSNPFVVNSAMGNMTTVSKPSAGSFKAVEQDFNWFGNFAVGAQAIYTQSGATMTLTFAQPVLGVGAQIQPNLTQFGGYPFTGTIEAFDSVGTLLGSFSRPGSSSANGDNSAIFIGVRSTDANIKEVRFGVPGFSAFAINRVDIATPEPGALAILPGVLAAGGLLLLAQRRGRTRPSR